MKGRDVLSYAATHPEDPGCFGKLCSVIARPAVKVWCQSGTPRMRVTLNATLIDTD